MKIFVSIILLASVVLAEPPRYPQQYQQRQYYFARQQEEAAPYPASGWKPEGSAFNIPQRQVQQQYGAPDAPQQQYGAPNAPQQQYGAPSAPQQQYRSPAAASQQQYRSSAASQQQYRASAASQQQYRVSGASQQYKVQSAPQQQYGTPNAPQQQYGAPSVPQQQYGAPTSPQREYGAPTGPQREYGTPEDSTTTEPPNTTEEEEISTVQGITESESEPVNAVNELEDEDVDEKQPQQTGEYYVALPDGRLQRVRYISRQNVEAMRYFAKIRADNVEPLRGPVYAYAPLQKLQIVPAGLQLSVAPIATVTPADGKPQKLEIEPVTQVQYQYDNPSSVVPLTNPVSAPYVANYQTPAAAGDTRFLLTFQ